MVRVRSPNYPAFGLPKAIDLARKIYTANHTHRADPLTVAKVLGYSTLNGGSLTALSAMKKYELLEESQDKQLRVSKLALSILVDPPGSSERSNAIIQAASAPSLFAELRAEYGDQPPSDTLLKSFLLKRGFAPSMVDAPIRAFRETMMMVEEARRVESIAGVADAFLDAAASDQKLISDTVDDTAREIESARPATLPNLLVSATGSTAGRSEAIAHSQFLRGNVVESSSSQQPLMRTTGSDQLLVRHIAPSPEREWMSGKLGRDTSFRIMIDGDITTKHLELLVRLVQAQAAAYED